MLNAIWQQGMWEVWPSFPLIFRIRPHFIQLQVCRFRTASWATIVVTHEFPSSHSGWWLLSDLWPTQAQACPTNCTLLLLTPRPTIRNSTQPAESKDIPCARHDCRYTNTDVSGLLQYYRLKLWTSWNSRRDYIPQIWLCSPWSYGV
jgi:hypothetical protein